MIFLFNFEIKTNQLPEKLQEKFSVRTNNKRYFPEDNRFITNKKAQYLLSL